MQTAQRNNKGQQKMKIRTGVGNTLVLLVSGLRDIFWMIEKIIPLMNREEGVPVKSSLFATVLRFHNPADGDSFFYKEFHNRGAKDVLKNLFGFTRGKRAFRAGQLLLQYGFLTPEPVLYGVQKTFFFIRSNFLITRAVSGDRTYQYLKHHFHLPLPGDVLEEKRALLSAAGREIGRLHKAGIFHGDLRVGNIILSGRGAATRFYFIDNERTTGGRRLSEKKRLKNLVQLNMVRLPHITVTDRLRFLTAYLQENPDMMPHKKEFMKRIVLLTKKRQQAP
jgi:tRNA A-37 threonylcarbamoyl transferase component Bud32